MTSPSLAPHFYPPPLLLESTDLTKTITCPRYLHYFAETTDLAEDELEASNKERELLTHLDGTHAALGKVQQDGVPGIGEIEYW